MLLYMYCLFVCMYCLFRMLRYYRDHYSEVSRAISLGLSFKNPTPGTCLNIWCLFGPNFRQLTCTHLGSSPKRLQPSIRSWS